MTTPRFIDISWPLDHKTLAYPGDPGFKAEATAHVASEGHAMHTITLSNHTGTHVDAPAHFFENGMTVDRIGPEILCGDALVLDARPAGKKIDAGFLDRSGIKAATRILLRTTNEALLPVTFSEDHAALTADAAVYLRDRTSVRLVGIDYLSIEAPGDPSWPVHKTLLGAKPPVFVLEGLDLGNVAPGLYTLFCLPLLLKGLDGAPARAVLGIGHRE